MTPRPEDGDDVQHPQCRSFSRAVYWGRTIQALQSSAQMRRPAPIPPRRRAWPCFSLLRKRNVTSFPEVRVLKFSSCGNLESCFQDGSRHSLRSCRGLRASLTRGKFVDNDIMARICGVLRAGSSAVTLDGCCVCVLYFHCAAGFLYTQNAFHASLQSWSQSHLLCAFGSLWL